MADQMQSVTPLRHQYLIGFVCGAAAAACASGFLFARPYGPYIVRQEDKFLSPRAPEGLPSSNVSTAMQSLQIDVYGLPKEFLDSTEQVNSLMNAAISKFTGVGVLQEMTYHFRPVGLTSLWLLSASHASIHTWPTEGYAAIDFLTCGSTDLANISAVVEDLLKEVSEDAIVQFSLTQRGQGPRRRSVNDLAVQLMSLEQEKSAFYRGRSQYQSIEVWDVRGNSWVDGDHEDTNRRLYLDGVLQLSTEDEAIYHETLVHPAMLTHKGPENVVIMGGGDGGALTNVLRHRSVKSARLVEIDAQVVEVSKEAFPSFTNAFFDPRAEVVIADAFRWIADLAQKNPSSLDALFFDLLDINVPSPLLDAMFSGDRLGNFISQTRKVLRAGGFAVFQLGERRTKMGACLSLEGDDASCEGAIRQHAFVEELRGEFKTVFVYSQRVPSFLGDWLFAVATDDAGFLEQWRRPASEVDGQLAARLFEHKTLSFFSGMAAQRLQAEADLEKPEVFGRFKPRAAPPRQASCPGLTAARRNSAYPGYAIPYLLANSAQGYGLGVYTLRNISRGEVIWRWHDESFREVTASNWRKLVEGHPYAREYGVKAFLEKDWVNEYVIPAKDGEGVVTKMFMQLDDARFTNHGYTTSDVETYLHLADKEGASAAPEEHKFGRAIIATRDIKACEEILEDYQSAGRDLEEDMTEQTPEFWTEVLSSYGLTNKRLFPPGEKDFPSWARLGGPANSD